MTPNSKKQGRKVNARKIGRVVKGTVATPPNTLELMREAEREAYERAAHKAETFFDWCAPIGEHANMAMAQGFAEECATAIRALMEEPALERDD